MRFRLRLKKKLSSGAGKATGAYKTHKKTLRKMRGPSEKGFHDLRLDGKTIGQALAENKYEEIFDRESLLKSLLKKKDQGTVKKKFKEFSTSKEAENFIKELLKLDANYDNLDVSVANDVNQELIRAYNIFGTVGIIGSVHVDDERVNGDVYASYDDNPPNSLLLRSDRNREDVKAKMEKNPEGYFSTRSWLHPYRHEIGHALWEYFAGLYPNFKSKMESLHKKHVDDNAPEPIFLSTYSLYKPDEMFAEAIAEFMNGTISELTIIILNELLTV